MSDSSDIRRAIAELFIDIDPMGPHREMREISNGEVEANLGNLALSSSDGEVADTAFDSTKSE